LTAEQRDVVLPFLYTHYAVNELSYRCQLKK